MTIPFGHHDAVFLESLVHLQASLRGLAVSPPRGGGDGGRGASCFFFLSLGVVLSVAVTNLPILQDLLVGRVAAAALLQSIFPIFRAAHGEARMMTDRAEDATAACTFRDRAGQALVVSRPKLQRQTCEPLPLARDLDSPEGPMAKRRKGAGPITTANRGESCSRQALEGQGERPCPHSRLVRRRRRGPNSHEG
eukprot:scaffold1277_cov253-Pinguiococcus_pyrenoidosus.AAC.16